MGSYKKIGLSHEMGLIDTPPPPPPLYVTKSKIGAYAFYMLQIKCYITFKMYVPLATKTSNCQRVYLTWILEQV